MRVRIGGAAAGVERYPRRAIETVYADAQAAFGPREARSSTYVALTRHCCIIRR
jgi:hypothetical protein